MILAQTWHRLERTGCREQSTIGQKMTFFIDSKSYVASEQKKRNFNICYKVSMFESTSMIYFYALLEKVYRQ